MMPEVVNAKYVIIGPNGDSDGVADERIRVDESIALNPGSTGKPNGIGEKTAQWGESWARNQVLIGSNARGKENGTEAIAIGNLAYARADQSVVVGAQSWADSQSVAVGANVYALDSSSIAIGSDDNASYKQWITKHDYDSYFEKIYKEIDPNGSHYGFVTNSPEDQSKAGERIYSPTVSYGKGAIALGSRSVAFRDGATSMGTLAFALGKGSTSLGTLSRAEGEGSIALGNKTNIFASNSVGTGNEVQVLNEGGMGYGYKAYSGGKGSIAIGRNVFANTKMITKDTSKEEGVKLETTHNTNGMADWIKTPTEAENKRINENNAARLSWFDIIKSNAGTAEDYITQNIRIAAIAAQENKSLKEVVEQLERENKLNITAEQKEKLLKETDNYLTALDGYVGTGLGAQLGEKNGVYDIIKSNDKNNAIVIGTSSVGLGNNSIALGKGAFSLADNSFAIGSYSYADNENAVALGLSSKAMSKNAMAFGVGSAVSTNSEKSISIGSASVVEGKNSAIFGTNSYVQGENSIVIGTQTNAYGNSNLSFGNEVTIENSENNLSLGNSTKIAAGVKSSVVLGNEASIGAEDLQKDTNIENATAIGFGAKVVEGKGEKETGINSMALGKGAVATLENSVALGVDSTTDYTFEQLQKTPWASKGAISIPTSGNTGVISVGSRGQERRIVNVASGALDTDAVNVAQLKTLEERFDTQMDGLNEGGGIQYLSVEKSKGEAGKAKANIDKITNYNKYVKLEKELMYIKARQEIADEKFNQKTVDELQKKVNDILDGDSTIPRGEDNPFKDVIADIASAKTKTGEAKSQAFAEIMKEIGTIADKLEADGYPDKNIAKDIEASKKNNYLNQGAQGIDSIALGYAARTSGENEGLEGEHAVAIGFGANAESKSTVVIGDKATIGKNLDNSIAIGTGATVNAKDSVAIGFGAKAGSVVGIPSATIKEIKYGEYAGKNPVGSFSVGDTGKERTITNVAAGRVSSDSTDAINGSQLYATNSVLSNLANTSKNVLGDSFELDKNTGEIKVADGGIGGTRQTTISGAISSLGDKTITLSDGSKDISKNLSSNPKFVLTGTDDIAVKVNETDNQMNFSLNKGTVAVGENNVVSGDAVFNAIKKAKPVVKGKGIVKVEGQKTNNLSENTFTVSINEAELKDTLNNDYVTKTDYNIGNGIDPDKWKEKLGVSDLALHYKADGESSDRTITLAKGLTFKGDDNIKVATEDNGVVKHTLNNDLTGINSISGNGQKISLTSAGTDLNNKKIINMGSGDIKAESTDAVTGGDVYKTLQDYAKNSDISNNYLNVTNANITFAGETGTYNLDLTSNDRTFNIVTKTNQEPLVDAAKTNIKTIVDGNKLTITHSVTPTFDEIHVGGPGGVSISKNKPNGVSPDNFVWDDGLPGMIYAAGYKIANIAPGEIKEGSKAAVNGGQIFKVREELQGNINNNTRLIDENKRSIENINTLANRGWDISVTAGTSPKSKTVKPGEKLNVKGKDNILVDLETTDKTLVISMNQSPQFGAIQINNNGKIVGLKSGTATGDAVEYSQLKPALDALNLTIDQNGNVKTGHKYNGKDNIDAALQELKNKSDKKITFKNGNSVSQEVALGESIDFVGIDNNPVSVKMTGDTYTISIADSPEFKGKVSAKGFDAGSQKITNVLNGTEAHDTVNFGQLKEVEKKINNTAEAAIAISTNSPAAYTAANENNGDRQDIVVKIGNKYYFKDNVKSEDGILKPKDSDKEITDVTKIQVSAIDSYGNVTDPIKLSNIADGKIESGSTDAINGAQIQNLKESIAKEINKSNQGTKDLGDHLWTLEVNDENGKTVKAKDVVNFKSEGDNIAITETEDNNKHNVTFKLNDKLTLGNVVIDGTGTGKSITIGTGRDEVKITTEYITGLKNTEWDSINKVVNRAATEGQLHKVEEGITTKITNINQNIEDLGNPVKYDDADKNIVTLEGQTGTGTKITNLAVGAVNQGSTDAVTGGQLYDVHRALMGDAATGNPFNFSVELNDNNNFNHTPVTDVRKAIELLRDGWRVSGGDVQITYDENNKPQLHLDAISGATNIVQGQTLVLAGDGNNITTHSGSAKVTNVKYKDPVDGEEKTFSGKIGMLQIKMSEKPTFEDVIIKKEGEAQGDSVVVKKDLADLENRSVKYDDPNSKTVVTLNPNGDPTSIKHMAAGTEDNDAVNVKQIKDLVGGDIAYDGTKWTGMGFETLKGKGMPTVAPTGILDAIKANTSAINRGLVFEGDNDNNDPQYLGSKLSVKTDKVGTEFEGKNLKTEYKLDSDSGNGTIKIGLSKNPEFDSMTLGKIKMTPEADKLTLSKDNGLVVLDGLKPGQDSSSAVTKGEIDEFKSQLGLNGKDGTSGSAGSTGPAGKDGLDGKSIIDKVQGLRDGMAGTMVYTDESGNRLIKDGDNYYKKGLVKAKKDGKYYESTSFEADGTLKSDAIPVNAVNKEDIRISAVNTKNGATTDPVILNNVKSVYDGGTVSDLLGLSGKDLDVAATTKDLQAVAKAGLSFKGNDTKVIGRPIGSQLGIEGRKNTEYVITTTENTGNSHIYSDVNMITHSDGDVIRIEMLKSPKFEGIVVNNGQDGANGKNSIITVDENGNLIIKNGVSGQNGQPGADGLSGKDGKDGQKVATIKDVDDLSNKLGLNGKDGTSGTSGTDGPAGKDGLDGKSIIDKVQGLRDGFAGTMVYTDENGNRLIKDGDNYYKAGLVKAKKDGKYYESTSFEADGTLKSGAIPVNAVNKEDIRISAVNTEDGKTTIPVILNNVKSALGLNEPGVNAQEKVKELIAIPTSENNKLDVAATARDLQAVAKSGIAFKGNDLGILSIPLGEEINIKGNNEQYKAAENGNLYSSDNLITHKEGSDTLRIEMLKSPKFETLNLAQGGNKTVTLTPGSGELKLSNTSTPGDSNVVLSGLKGGEGKDTAVTKGQLDKLKEDIGLTSDGTSGDKGASGKDGLNGKTINEKIQGLRDGLAGTVVYTDKDGNRLVRDIDNNFYKREDVEATDSEGKPKYKKANNGRYYMADSVNEKGELTGTPTLANLESVDPVKLSTVDKDGSTTKAIALSNVKSGLGFTEPVTEDKALEGMNTLKTKSGADLNNVATVMDLQALAKAGIVFKGNQGTAKGIHKGLGETLTIQGKPAEPYDVKNFSPENILTRETTEGTIMIEMLKSPSFRDIVINGKDGKDGKSAIITVDKDGHLVVKDGVNGRDGLKGLDGTSGKDGRDGLTKIITEKDMNSGTSGTMVYTDKDGNRLVEVDGKYYAKETIDEKTKDLVKVDGKYYNKTSINPETGEVNSGENPVNIIEGLSGTERENVVISTVNPDGKTTTPTTIGNVKGLLDSGLADNITNNNIENYKTQLDEKKAAEKEAQKALDDAKATPNGENIQQLEENLKAAKEAVAAAEETLNDEKNSIYNALSTKSEGIKAAKVVTEKLLGNELNADTAATVGDLRTIAVAGLDFAGNDGEVIHRNLGTQLNIEGISTVKYDNSNKDKYSADNLITHKADDNTLRIEMLKSPLFKDLVINGANGKDGKDGKSAIVTVDKDGNLVVKNGADGRDGLDGLDGATGANGRDGFSKIVTEKDLNAGTSGTMVYTDKDGNRVVEIAGKYYGKDEIADKTKDLVKVGEKYYAKSSIDPATGKVKEGQSEVDITTGLTGIEKTDVQISTVNPDGTTTTATVIRNVASSLTPDGISTDESEAKRIAAKLTDTGTPMDVKDLNKAATVGDLRTVAVAGLDFVGNDGEVIHRNLGTQLNIEGKEDTKYISKDAADKWNAKEENSSNKIKETASQYSADNLITHRETKEVAGKKVEILRIEMLKKPNFEGLVVNNGKDGTDGKSAVITVDDKGNVIVKNGIDGKDGIDGRPGKDGFSKIVTEKDLKDGTLGVMVYTDKDGNELVKADDGNYYKKDGFDNLVKGTDDKYYAAGDLDGDKNPKPNTKPQIVDAQISAVNPDGKTTTPTVIDNVKGTVAAEAGLKEVTPTDETAAEQAVTDAEQKIRDAETALANAKGLPDSDHGKEDKIKAAKDGLANAKSTLASAERAKADLAARKDSTDLQDIAGAQSAVAKLTSRTEGLDNAATVGDLKTLALSGLDFAGNEGTTIHKNLGQSLSIEGKKGVRAADGSYSADNLITRNDEGTLRIEMLKDPSFSDIVVTGKDGKDGKDGKTSIITVDKDGNLVVKNGTNGRNGLDGLDGATGTNGRDGFSKIITEKDLQGGTSGSNGADGLDGKSIVDKVNSLRDGLSGPMVYTDAAGNRIVKGNDGHFYAKGDIDSDGNPTGTALNEKDIHISAVNPDGSTQVATILGNTKGIIREAMKEFEDTDVTAAKDAVNTAENTLAAAKAALTAAKNNFMSDANDANRQAYFDAMDKVSDATKALKAKEEALALAKPKAVKDAEDAITTAQNALTTAETAVVKARKTLDEAQKAFDKDTENVDKKNILKDAIDKLAMEEAARKDALNKLNVAKVELDKAKEKALKDKETENASEKVLLAQNAVKDKLLKAEGKDINTVATVGDLQAVALAGLDFEGNDEEVIHKNLGEKLNIEGMKDAKYHEDKYSTQNLVTYNDDGTLRVAMLKNPKFETITLSNRTGDVTLGVDGKDGIGIKGKDGTVDKFVTENRLDDKLQGKGFKVKVTDGDGNSQDLDVKLGDTVEFKNTDKNIVLKGTSGTGTSTSGGTTTGGTSGGTTAGSTGGSSSSGTSGTSGTSEHTVDINLAKDLKVDNIKVAKKVEAKEVVADKVTTKHVVTEKLTTDKFETSELKVGTIVIKNGEITGVKTAELDESGHIAKEDEGKLVNGGTLNKTIDNLRAENAQFREGVQGAIQQNSQRISKLETKVNKGLANAAAMAGINFMEIGVNQATVGAAVGGYEGTQAVAVGVQAAPTQDLRINAKVSLTPGSHSSSMYSVGASWRFDLK